MSYVVVHSLPFPMPDHHDLVHVGLWLRVPLAVHLAGQAPHIDARSGLHVPRACVLLLVREVCLLAGLRLLVYEAVRLVLHYITATYSCVPVQAHVLPFSSSVCLCSWCAFVILEDLRGPGVLLAARQVGGLYPHHVPEVKVYLD